MKKAVIAAGGKQYLVAEGETIQIELLNTEGKNTDFLPLLVIDGESVKVGAPEVKGSKVSADVVEQDEKSEKVTSIRYKPKKRVRKTKGHRQRYTTVKIKKIS